MVGEGKQYLLDRGMTEDTIKVWNIEYDNEERAIIFPYIFHPQYYIKVEIDSGEIVASDDPKRPLYSFDSDRKVMFLTVSPVDTLLLWQAEVAPVASLDDGDVSRLDREELPEYLIFFSDGTDFNRAVSGKLREKFEGTATEYLECSFPSFQDSGERDYRQESLRDYVDAIKESCGIRDEDYILWEDGKEDGFTNAVDLLDAYDAGDVDSEPEGSLANYLTETIDSRLDKFQTYKDRKTGFSNIDNKIGALYPGLYILGALPSLGKTTFCHQLADQLAEEGGNGPFLLV